MISRRGDSWINDAGGSPSRTLALMTCALLLSACAGMTDAGRSVKYTLAGADVALRKNLDRGLLLLKTENYPAARDLLNRAIWELEQIESPWLRLQELAEAHRALADVYSGLRKPEWAHEERELANALARLAESATGSESPEKALGRGKGAYFAAQFREALTSLGEALVGLENLTHPPARVKDLEDARCYLAFTYFALDQPDRAGEEIRRLRALDATVAFCQQEAPPSIRRLILEVRNEPALP